MKRGRLTGTVRPTLVGDQLMRWEQGKRREQGCSRYYGMGVAAVRDDEGDVCFNSIVS